MTRSETIRLEGAITVRGAAEHPHATRRLRQVFPALDWIEAVNGQEPLHTPTVQLRTDFDAPEGGFTLSVASSDGIPSIHVEGGPFSGVIYGVEELIQRRAQQAGDAIEVEVGRVEQAPGLRYRTFWTWDHSTNWDLEQIGVQEIGVFNPYSKPPDGFLSDYKRVVDFTSQHRIAAVVIYGMFRDSHGGVAAAQELCRYANERGVRILPGVAINAYGGVYWEGDHPYNLATWLRAHPELAATMERPVGFQLQDLDFPLFFPRSDYTVRGCPSRKENQDWMAEGIAWLTETCEIGGINIEAGDYGVCGCALCEQRRAEREDKGRREGYVESWSHADMSDFYPRLYDAALANRPNLWLYSELQWDNLLDVEAMQPLRALPDGGIYQHTVNRSYWRRVRKEVTADHMRELPTKTNVFRCQFCSQWNGDRRTERYRFNGRDFAEMAWKAAASGIQGLTVWGESSPYNVSTELSYLAFARFTYDPALTWERFLSEEVASRVGGDAAAVRYLDIMTTLDASPMLDAGVLRRMQAEALDGARHADDEVARRWVWVAERVARRRVNAQG
jgi:hypothetical protein